MNCYWNEVDREKEICGEIIKRAVLNVQYAREFVCVHMREGPGVSVCTCSSDQLCWAAWGLPGLF